MLKNTIYNTMNEKIIQLLEYLAEILVDQLKLELVRYNLGDSEIYKNIKAVVSGTDVTIEMPDYWIFIENGRRPNSTPPDTRPGTLSYDSLIDWMRRKRIAPGRENRVIWVIARAIGRRGIDPRHFASDAIDNLNRGPIDGLFFDFSSLLDKEITEKLIIINR